jgi:hypothetical protein
MIKLVSDTINKEDINSLIEWLSQDEIPRLTKGELTVELENKWANKIGTKYSVFVNSGSSSILLTLAALKHTNRLKNNKVVVPSLSWATDLSSPIILELEPVLCDCNLSDLSCDLDHLEDDSGYIFENWKIEPFVGFKITMEDGTQFILTKPEEFKEFGITLFEHSTSEFEPENDCNV